MWHRPAPAPIRISEPPPAWTPFDFYFTSSWKNIVRLVALRYGTTVADILGRSRMREHAVPRMIAIYLVRQHCPQFSLPDLGRRFDRDHSTILHALHRAPALIEQRGAK